MKGCSVTVQFGKPAELKQGLFDLRDAIRRSKKLGMTQPTARFIMIAFNADQETKELARGLGGVDTGIEFWEPPYGVDAPMGIPIREHERRVRKLGREEYMFALVNELVEFAKQIQ